MAEEIKYRNLGAFSSAGGFNVANADPIDSRQLVATIGHIYQDGNWDAVKPYPGLIVSAADSGEVRVYVGPAYDKNQPTVKPWTSEDNWKKIGGGATQVAKYSDAVALIETSEVDGQVVVKNLGQVIYVTGTETIGDVTYEPGAYIVSGATSLSKLGTTTASGNLANDVAVLQGKVSTVEGKVSTLEGKVSTLEGEMDAVEGRLDVVEGRLDAVEPKVEALEKFRDETYVNDKTAIEKSITDNKAEIETWKTDVYDVDKATLEEAIEAAQASGDESVKDVKVAGVSVVTDNVANITFESELVSSEGVATTSENAPTAKSVAEAIVELRGQVTSIPKFKIEVVPQLPTEEIKDSYIYLVANSLTADNEAYSEYIYVNNTWEKLGEIKVDMSQYYTKTEVDGEIETVEKAIEDLDKEFTETLKSYYKATEVDDLLTGKIDKATYEAKVAEVEGRIKALEDWKTEFVETYAADKKTLSDNIDDAYKLADAANKLADAANKRKISLEADTYTKAKELATAEVIGQVILVKNEETITVGEDSHTYAAGPYIVSAVGEILSLSTSTGDVNADIATQLGSRIGAVETSLGTFQATYATDKKNLDDAIGELQGDVADINTNYKVKDITVDGVSAVVEGVFAIETITTEDITGLITPATEE